MKMGQALGTALITQPNLLPAIESAPLPAILPSNQQEKAHLPALVSIENVTTSTINKEDMPSEPVQNQLVPLQSNIDNFENKDPLGIPDNQLIQIIQDCEQANEELILS